MDTSLSKALIMVAGVLLAMIVIAFMTFTFNRIGIWATTADDEELSQQKAEFNREYEVYDKNLMYGVDVISCLNKAKSNNDKIRGKYAEGLDSSYEIKVTVKLKSEYLDESLVVYHIINSATDKEVAYINNDGPTVFQSGKETLADLKFKVLNTKYANLSTTFTNDTEIKTITDKQVKLDDTELTLTKDSGENTSIIQLLSASNAVSQIVKNTDSASRNNVDGWTKVEFRSALYDFKKKKFKCMGITYKESGLVDTITFKEI